MVCLSLLMFVQTVQGHLDVCKLIKLTRLLKHVLPRVSSEDLLGPGGMPEMSKRRTEAL